MFRLSNQVAPAHLSITHDGGFTLSLFKLNIKQESCEYQLLSVFDLTVLGMKPRSTVSVVDALAIRLLSQATNLFCKPN